MKGHENNPHFHIESTGSASLRDAAFGRKGFPFFLFFFTDFEAAFLYVVIYSGIVDDRQNIFKQPCAGTVTVNLYLPRKTRVDLHYFFFKCYFNRLFVYSSDLSNDVLVKISLRLV